MRTIDVIRNKKSRYLLSRRLRFCTRRLCNPQAASIAASETPSFVFRKTSFPMRQRLTPESACSTLTRMRANFQFVRFSAAVSSPRGGPIPKSGDRMY